MKSNTTLMERLIAQSFFILALSGIVYWYSHLWHHGSAAKIHYWPHSLGLALALWILIPQNNPTSVMTRLMQLVFAASLITQTLVWLGLLTAPIF